MEKDEFNNTKLQSYNTLEHKDSLQEKASKTTAKFIEFTFLVCAIFSVFLVIVIAYFIFQNGIPAIGKVGVANFLFDKVWEPSGDTYGILAFIVGSIYATLGAIIIGVPIGVLTAIYIAEIAPNSVVKVMKPAVDLLAGIPSVVYGFFGLVVLVPIIKERFGGAGNSLLAAIIILSIMILPTIISICETTIRAVPKIYKEGALALGASHIESIFTVIIPAAKSGIMAAIVLGTGRAVGEAMAVILVAGNSPIIPTSIFDSFRTMTGTIAMEMAYSSGLHQDMLFAIGVVLFVFIMLLNILLNIFSYRAGGK